MGMGRGDADVLGRDADFMTDEAARTIGISERVLKAARLFVAAIEIGKCAFSGTAPVTSPSAPARIHRR